LIVLLLAIVGAVLLDPLRPTPLASAPAPTWTPAPTRAPTPTPAPYAGSIADLALRFDVEEALVHAEELASERYAGRQGGSPGGRAAIEYLVAQFEALGLAPAGTDGYLQPFDLPYVAEAAVPTLTFDAVGSFDAAESLDAVDALVFAEDYRHLLGGHAAGGVADGRVIWLDGCGASEFDAHDVRGEVVLCRAAPGVDLSARAASEGAEGLLLVSGEGQRIPERRAPFEAPRADGIPTLVITAEAGKALRAGATDLGPLPVTAHLAVELSAAGEAEGANVLGVLPGADSTRSDRVVIIGAHLDHVGADPNGAVYHGANDNASGVAALLEIARSWRAANYQPEATVLFAAWDGEEQGLLGARHYVDHPTLPLDATIGMIQLDMVGMADAGNLTYDGEGNAVGRQLAASAEWFDVPTGIVRWDGGSDHAAFLRAGVDAGLLIWDAAEVPYYHTPEDTFDTLQPERLRQAGIIASHAALTLAGGTPGEGPLPTREVAGRSLYDLGTRDHFPGSPSR